MNISTFLFEIYIQNYETNNIINNKIYSLCIKAYYYRFVDNTNKNINIIINTSSILSIAQRNNFNLNSIKKHS